MNFHLNELMMIGSDFFLRFNTCHKHVIQIGRYRFKIILLTILKFQCFDTCVDCCEFMRAVCWVFEKYAPGKL